MCEFYFIVQYLLEHKFYRILFSNADFNDPKMCKFKYSYAKFPPFHKLVLFCSNFYTQNELDLFFLLIYFIFFQIIL